MSKEITVREIEATINEYTDIVEPIIVKRENNTDLIIMSVDEYKKMLFFAELDIKIAEGEEDIKNNNLYNAREIFKELREKYEY